VRSLNGVGQWLNEEKRLFIHLVELSCRYSFSVLLQKYLIIKGLLVRPPRFERGTFPLGGGRSIQLS
jgi:hypothetical protein